MQPNAANVSDKLIERYAQWLEALRLDDADYWNDDDWETKDDDADISIHWEGLSMREHFERLCIIFQVGIETIARGDEELAEQYEELAEMCANDQLEALFHSPDLPDASTLVYAYRVMRHISPAAELALSQIDYDRFFNVVDAVLQATPVDATDRQWLLVLKQDYRKRIMWHLDELSCDQSHGAILTSRRTT